MFSGPVTNCESPAARGDEAVEALAEMADGDRTGARGAADRQVEIDQRVLRMVGRQQQPPAVAGLPRQHRRRVVGRVPA